MIFIGDYEKVKELDDVHIIGLADSREDAAELVREIIDTVYRETGTFNVERYYTDARDHLTNS